WLLGKMGRNLHMPNSTWLVSRELTDATGPWDSTLFVDDDGEYFCRVLLQSDSVRFVPGAKAYYRASGSGSVSYIGRSNRKLEDQLRSMKLHIGYLRSLEDSDRVRAASVKYLQNWLPHFYPERVDLMEEVRRLASELGGRLEEPGLSWKYSWIKSVFGWRVAKRAQHILPQVRWSAARAWDKALLRIESRGLVLS